MNSHYQSNPLSDDDRIAELLKAIGHPVRLRIVRELSKMDNRCCGEMCDCFELSQSTVSQHLAVLKDAGLVSVAKQGTRSCYSIETSAFQVLNASLQTLVQNTEAE